MRHPNRARKQALESPLGLLRDVSKASRLSGPGNTSQHLAVQVGCSTSLGHYRRAPRSTPRTPGLCAPGCRSTHWALIHSHNMLVAMPRPFWVGTPHVPAQSPPIHVPHTTQGAAMRARRRDARQLAAPRSVHRGHGRGSTSTWGTEAGEPSHLHHSAHTSAATRGGMHGNAITMWPSRRPRSQRGTPILASAPHTPWP